MANLSCPTTQEGRDNAHRWGYYDCTLIFDYDDLYQILFSHGITHFDKPNPETWEDRSGFVLLDTDAKRFDLSDEDFHYPSEDDLDSSRTTIRVQPRTIMNLMLKGTASEGGIKLILKPR